MNGGGSEGGKINMNECNENGSRDSSTQRHEEIAMEEGNSSDDDEKRRSRACTKEGRKGE